MSIGYRKLLRNGAFLSILLVPEFILASSDISIIAKSDDPLASSKLVANEEDTTYWGREIRRLNNQMMSMPPESKISVRGHLYA
jgi:hypothetical protein